MSSPSPRPDDNRQVGRVLIAVGGMWIALTGACTASIYGDEYGFWVVGPWVIAHGLYLILFGLRAFARTAETRRNLGLTVVVLGLALLGLLLLPLIASAVPAVFVAALPVIGLESLMIGLGARAFREKAGSDVADVF